MLWKSTRSCPKGKKTYFWNMIKIYLTNIVKFYFYKNTKLLKNLCAEISDPKKNWLSSFAKIYVLNVSKINMLICRWNEHLPVKFDENLFDKYCEISILPKQICKFQKNQWADFPIRTKTGCLGLQKCMFRMLWKSARSCPEGKETYLWNLMKIYLTNIVKF